MTKSRLPYFPTRSKKNASLTVLFSIILGACTSSQESWVYDNCIDYAYTSGLALLVKDPVPFFTPDNCQCASKLTLEKYSKEQIALIKESASDIQKMEFFNDVIKHTRECYDKRVLKRTLSGEWSKQELDNMQLTCIEQVRGLPDTFKDKGPKICECANSKMNGTRRPASNDEVVRLFIVATKDCLSEITGLKLK